MKPRDGRGRKRPGLAVQRERVLDAAARLFSTQGVAAVSIGGICAEASISRPTFYRCFPDKDALVAHLYEHHVGEPVRMNLAELLSQPAGPRLVRTSLRALLDRMGTHPDRALFALTEASDPRTAAYRLAHASFEDVADRLEATLSGPSALPPRSTLLATMVACQWLTRQALVDGGSDTAKAAAVDAMFDLVSRVFRTGPSRR